MENSYANRRKIDPSKKRPDGTPLDNDRVEIGPTKIAFDEWAEAGLTCPNVAKMRQYRLDRLVKLINERDYGGLLLTDPLNIRYATDTTNMQVWNMHNPFRACLVTADGYMVIWDYKCAPFLTEFNPLIKEMRNSQSLFYFGGGDKTAVYATKLGQEVDEIMRAHVGNNRRLAVDKIMVSGLKALEKEGFEVFEGEELTEKARVIKGEEEILAMRCAIHATKQAVSEMRAVARPGLSEDEIWSVLHAGNIKRGGEWVECRLMASGPRTNPWFQECGPRIVQNNEILAFDTDLVSVYGICCDMSRSWFLGDGEPTAEMKRIYSYAVEHVEQNIQLLKPGVSFKTLSFSGHQLADEFVGRRYGCKMHGVGLCDEWPQIYYPQDWNEDEFNGELEPGMVLSVEAMIGREDGDFGVRIENQVLVTETGHEILSDYPYEEILLNR